MSMESTMELKAKPSHPIAAFKIWRDLPKVTALLSAFGLISYFFLSAQAISFAPLGDNAVWQIFTCHFAHWNAGHLFWSLGTFAVLGFMCEKIAPWKYVATLLLSLPLIPAVLLAFPAISPMPYGGISGVDSALFALLAGLLLKEQYAIRHWPGVSIGAFLIASFAFKICHELYAGAPLFLQDTEGMVPVPMAHLIGGAVGLCVGLIPNGKIQRN